MMESKLLVGGKSIVDKTTEQERALEQRRHEITEQKVSLIFNDNIGSTIYIKANDPKLQ